MHNLTSLGGWLFPGSGIISLLQSFRELLVTTSIWASLLPPLSFCAILIIVVFVRHPSLWGPLVASVLWKLTYNFWYYDTSHQEDAFRSNVIWILWFLHLKHTVSWPVTNYQLLEGNQRQQQQCKLFGEYLVLPLPTTQKKVSHVWC